MSSVGPGEVEAVKAAARPPQSKAREFVALLVGLEPNDVVSAIEGYEH